MDGAIETLNYLSTKYIVCTATNGPHLQQLNRLKISGIEKYITHNFISEEMGVAKPDKAFFTLALDRINERQREKGESELTFDNLIMIGDSLSSDMAGAKNSGIKTCFFDKNNKNIVFGDMGCYSGCFKPEWNDQYCLIYFFCFSNYFRNIRSSCIPT